MRLGLRAQIVLSLSLIFLVTTPLLVAVTVRLSRHAAEQHWRDAASRTAEAIRVGFEGAKIDSDTTLGLRLSMLLDATDARALRLQRPGRAVLMAGAPSGEAPIRLALSEGGELSMWPASPQPGSERGLQRMLIFYVGITWLLVIVLAYVLLTLLIVRPLEQVVRSSQSLASGSGVDRLDERGPTELHRLATTFNDMASQLRNERMALERRLAELQRTTAELSETQQHLVHGEKLATVGRMAAGLAHEIGNPLSAILGMVELLRSQALSPEEQAEFLARIQAETERIHGIIRDLLDFSRRDGDGDADGRPQQARVGDVIEDAVALLQPQRAAKEIAIEVHIQDGLPPVRGSKARLTQVLLNLLLNAADAIDGEGTITVEASATEAGDGDVCVSVRDDGPGIAVDMLAHLFEPFSTSKPVGKGTGLGLAVSHSLVEGMGGTIIATNCAPRGARFEIRLRAAT